MKSRCDDKTRKHYGAKGVTYCERWVSFANFLADMGARPESMTLDRLDNAKNYEPSNCRWATWEQQAANRSRGRSPTQRGALIEYDGKAHTTYEWAAITGITAKAIDNRNRRGWPVEEMLTRPTRAPRPRA